MSRTVAIAAVALAAAASIGCGADDTPPAHRDEDTVSSLLDAIDLDRTVALATDPEAALQLDDSCRVVSSIPFALDRDGGNPDAGMVIESGPLPLEGADLDAANVSGETVLQWEGPCILEDGARLEGSLLMSASEDGLVLSAEAFSIWEGDELQVALSGALELTRVDNLLQLDVSMQACGAMGPSCADTRSTPTVGLDLDYSIYPIDTFPERYSVSVSGAVDGEDRFVSIEGAWQADHSRCDAEPTEGSVVLGTLPRQLLTLEGAEQCDGCVLWQVEGIDVEPLCSASAW